VPVVLVEMGFLSNPEEDKLLTSQAYEDKLAKGLADGISEAIK
jgi:N-acetylmuramoyl-L-alanine amidase